VLLVVAIGTTIPPPRALPRQRCTQPRAGWELPGSRESWAPSLVRRGRKNAIRDSSPARPGVGVSFYS